MSVLRAQSIRELCQGSKPLITPFVERGVVSGKSFGLSACTYDCRVAQDLTLEPLPLALIEKSLRLGNPGSEQHRWITGARYRALASTIERFALPDNLCGSVLDKSSYARVFITAFNTHLDPGWEGWLTVELVNLGDMSVVYKAGDPVCQIKFEWLDGPTDLPYSGKYQRQPDEPVPSLHEDG